MKDFTNLFNEEKIKFSEIIDFQLKNFSIPPKEIPEELKGKLPYWFGMKDAHKINEFNGIKEVPLKEEQIKRYAAYLFFDNRFYFVCRRYVAYLRYEYYKAMYQGHL